MVTSADAKDNSTTESSIQLLIVMILKMIFKTSTYPLNASFVNKTLKKILIIFSFSLSAHFSPFNQNKLGNSGPPVFFFLVTATPRMGHLYTNYALAKFETDSSTRFPSRPHNEGATWMTLCFTKDLNTLPLFQRRVHQTINYPQFLQVYILR